MAESTILDGKEENVTVEKLITLNRMNVLQHEILKINPVILTQRDIKNLYKARVRLNVTLDELFLLLSEILEE